MVSWSRFIWSARSLVPVALVYPQVIGGAYEDLLPLYDHVLL